MGRFEVIRKYSRRLRITGDNDSAILIASNRGRHSSEEIEYVIKRIIESKLFRKRKVTRELIWNIYADAQNAKYDKTGLCDKPPPNTTRCYICSKLVGKDGYEHVLETIHPWSITPLIRDCQCDENFNFRICCCDCNAKVGSTNLYHEALSLGYGFVASTPCLAILEGIESLHYAFMFYFQYYKGASHGV